jgi:hypothetical protein
MAEDYAAGGTTKTIYATDVAACKFCVSSADGQHLHKKIQEALHEGRRVSISFADVLEISSAFLDVAIGQLYRGEFSEKDLKEKLTFLGLSKDDSFLLERVILRAKYYCGEPEQLDAAVCRLLGGEDES